MSTKCEFCKKEFSNLSNLYYHKKTAKYCLEKRNVTPKTRCCKNCDKSFVELKKLKIHEKKCIPTILYEKSEVENKYKRENEMYKMDIVKHKLNLNRDKEVYLIEIDSLKEKISDNEKIISEQQKTILEYKEQCATLQKTLQNITASKNTIVRPKIIKKITNINNIIINMLPITQEWMAEQCRLMTKEHYASPELLSKYLCEKILKDRSICTDVTRGTLRYKNEAKVTENFITNLEPKSRNIIPEIVFYF